MAHDIFGDRFIGRSTPAWHGLGTVFAQGRSIGVEEAVREAGCGYELEKVPVTLGAVPAWDGAKQATTDLMALVRQPTTDDDTVRFLGMVGSGYEIVSNLDIARRLEPLRDAWPVETVGALGKGDSFFVTLSIGRLGLGRDGSDAVDRFFLVNGNHGNGKGIRITETTVRVVCANTLEMALGSKDPRDAATRVTLDHVRGAGADLAVAVELMAKLRKLDDATVQRLQALSLKAVTESQVAAIFEAAWPMPDEPRKVTFAKQVSLAGLDPSRFAAAITDYEQWQAAVLDKRALATQCYSVLCDTTPAIAGTAWAAVNAVTEVTNHLKGRHVEESLLFGKRAGEQQRALSLALNLKDAPAARTSRKTLAATGA
jgi:phage/plasmid-like protein (TIGR03299 family)